MMLGGGGDSVITQSVIQYTVLYNVRMGILYQWYAAHLE